MKFHRVQCPRCRLITRIPSSFIDDLVGSIGTWECTRCRGLIEVGEYEDYDVYTNVERVWSGIIDGCTVLGRA